jgi:2-polyprenyl-3-methyl-5-hydroxy-6-metoxy-1,4-benzoquinol methylase
MNVDFSKIKLKLKECNYCGGSLQIQNWGAMVCDNCNSVAVIEPPTVKELANYYASFLRTYSGGGRSKGSKKRQHKWAEAYLKVVIQYSAEGKDLIDIGPANNPFPILAENHGFKVSVMDFSHPKSLPKSISFIKGSLNSNSKFLLNHFEQYDVVTAWAVIEHCLDIQMAFDTLVQFCKPGGIIILTTPEIGTISEKFGAGRTSWFYPPEHIYLISRKAIKVLFKSRGCEEMLSKKFEYNILRWLLRYGLIVAEGLIGYVLKKIWKDKWVALRSTRLTRSSGITLCVYRKDTK